MSVRSLEPAALWNHFADLNAVPRASKKEERVIAFMKNFGEQLSLETTVDAVGNVLIRKPATAGMEGKPTVLLQSHLDMVHQKNSNVAFDFATEGIRMRVDGDWVSAEGTTLGADNGIGVAAIMAILQSSDIPHPPIEALFTIDEETGMTGALGLQGGLLKARVMLNLDTENDEELTIGCAGGIDVTGNGTYTPVDPGGDMEGFSLYITGLKGGHSGMDIHLGRGNSNKLMNRLLSAASEKFGVRIAGIDGGSLRNAIPRESKAVLAVPARHAADFRNFVEAQGEIIRKEYATTDPELAITLTPSAAPTLVLDTAFADALLAVLYMLPNGIHRMSPDVDDLVQTSNNLARVFLADGSYTIQCLTRSSVDSEKTDLARGIRAGLNMLGAEVTFNGSYPGWTPRPDAGIVRLMREVYEQRFGGKPHVYACHAGLECGIVGANYPGMEMISFGPNITGAHSPDERVQISSVQKFWGYLLEVLQRIG